MVAAPHARWSVPLAAALGVVLLYAAAGRAPRLLGRGAPRPTSVVLVTVDTLRADAVSFQGEGPQTTPFLDRLAEDGVVFTSAYSPSGWTVPAMASLFSGLAPSSHGVTTGRIMELEEHRRPAKSVAAQPALPESFVTLAEAFRRAGYATIGIPSNLHLAEYLGFGQGFDHYYGEAQFLTADQVNLLLATFLQRAFGPRWRSAWKEQPAFLWVHYFDPHDPYFVREPWLGEYAPRIASDPAASPANLVMRDMKQRYPQPDEDLARQIRALYRAEVSYLDQHLAALDEMLGLSAGDVLFLLTADHGEEIVDHGGLGHGHSLYEELVHVPMLVRWTDGLRGGRRVEAQVSLLDVYPTLAELAGLELPPGLQGASLAPFLLGERDGGERALLFELDRPEVEALAVRRGRWKLVYQKAPEERVQLFDLQADPGERIDRAGENPALVRELTVLARERLAALPGPPEDAGSVAIDDAEALEQLQAFGYVGEGE